MEEQLHYISEVARIVGVEPHVLRYWEEELHLKIIRNSLGKRCYTQRDIRQLCRIKYWKDKGMQLKAVKEILEKEYWDPGKQREDRGFFEGEKAGETQQEEDSGERLEKEKERPVREEDQKTETISEELIIVEKPSDSVKRLEQILDGIIGQALERNNKKLVREICAVIMQQMEERLEACLEAHLDMKLEERLEECLDVKLEERLEECLDVKLEERLEECLDVKLEELLEDRSKKNSAGQWKGQLDAGLEERPEEKLRNRLEELLRKEPEGRMWQTGKQEAAASDAAVKTGKSLKKKWRQWMETWLGGYK